MQHRSVRFLYNNIRSCPRDEVLEYNIIDNELDTEAAAYYMTKSPGSGNQHENSVYSNKQQTVIPGMCDKDHKRGQVIVTKEFLNKYKEKFIHK